MVIVIDAGGNILNTIPERVYQGSNLANDIVLVGVIPVQSEITIAFTLPNGVEYEPQLTTRGVASFDGKDQYYWRYVIPAVITEYAGKVTFDFYVYNGSQIVATGAGGFLVERGVPGILPATPTADIYQQILQELAKVQGTSNDALLVAQQAKEIAEVVDGKATEALEKSAEAAAAAEKSAVDAEAAKEAAESISGTAQQALTVANQANTKAGQAQTAASNAQAAAQAAQSTADEALEAAQNADVKVDNVTIFKTEDKVLYLNEAYAEYLKQVTYANPTIAAFSMSPSGTSVEVGTTYSPTSFTHRETNVDNISGNLTLTSNRKSGYSLDVVPSGSSATVSLSGQGLEYKLGANDSVTYTLAGESTEDTNPSGMDFSRTVTISSYFPCYYGANGSAAITNVTGLTKKNSGNIAGTYTIDVAANQYVWFVTRGTVTSVKSSGFDVPMNEPDTVNLTFGGTSYAYKAYRVEGQVTVAGSYTYTVA